MSYIYCAQVMGAGNTNAHWVTFHAQDYEDAKRRAQTHGATLDIWVKCDRKGEVLSTEFRAVFRDEIRVFSAGSIKQAYEELDRYVGSQGRRCLSLWAQCIGQRAHEGRLTGFSETKRELPVYQLVDQTQPVVMSGATTTRPQESPVAADFLVDRMREWGVRTAQPGHGTLVRALALTLKEALAEAANIAPWAKFISATPIALEDEQAMFDRLDELIQRIGISMRLDSVVPSQHEAFKADVEHAFEACTLAVKYRLITGHQYVALQRDCQALRVQLGVTFRHPLQEALLALESVLSEPSVEDFEKARVVFERLSGR
jgi:hypothetical protein